MEFKFKQFSNIGRDNKTNLSERRPHEEAVGLYDQVMLLHIKKVLVRSLRLGKSCEK